MKRFVSSLFILLCFLSSLAVAMTSLSIDQISDGYRGGRLDAAYGTYTSVFQEQSKSYQERLAYLDSKAFGLSRFETNNVTQAKLEYLMEAETLRLFMDIINDQSLPSFEKQSLMLGTIRLYQSVRQEGERLFEDMVRYIDIAKPGPNGLQIRFDDSSKKGQSLYSPNYRADRLLSDSEKAQAYQLKLAEFISSGGHLSEMKELTVAFLKELPSFSRLEYVVRENGQVWVTGGKAGHLLLAEGKTVRAAGQILLIKDRQNKVQLAVISNASGTYKPDLSSLFDSGVFRKIQRVLRISHGQWLPTRGEPFSTQTLKIYMKGMNLDKKFISAEEQDLLSAGKEILFNPRTLTCQHIYLF